MRRVRSIAATFSGDRVAVAEWRPRVAVWNVRRRCKISEFETIMDPGGSRLAITSDGRPVIAAAYERYGIACYDADTGALLWQRKDLKKTQSVCISRDDKTAFFTRWSLPGEALDVETGADIGSMDGVGTVIASPFADARVIEFGPQDSILVANGRKTFISTTARLIQAAFSPDSVVISEMATYHSDEQDLANSVGGPVRCFSLSDARELWRLDGPPGSSAPWLAYVQRPRMFVAVRGSYLKPRQDWLIHIDCATGEVRRRIKVPDSPDYGFCFHGRRILTWNGSILDTVTAKRVARLRFPSTAR